MILLMLPLVASLTKLLALLVVAQQLQQLAHLATVLSLLHHKINVILALILHTYYYRHEQKLQLSDFSDDSIRLILTPHE